MVHDGDGQRRRCRPCRRSALVSRSTTSAGCITACPTPAKSTWCAGRRAIRSRRAPATATPVNLFTARTLRTPLGDFAIGDERAGALANRAVSRSTRTIGCSSPRRAAIEFSSTTCGANGSFAASRFAGGAPDRSRGARPDRLGGARRHEPRRAADRALAVPTLSTLPPGCTKPSRIARIARRHRWPCCATPARPTARVWILDRRDGQRETSPSRSPPTSSGNRTRCSSSRDNRARISCACAIGGARHASSSVRCARAATTASASCATPDRLLETPAMNAAAAERVRRRARSASATGRARGFRLAVPARLIYERIGRVTTYRLDSGDVPDAVGTPLPRRVHSAGTDVRVHAVALDETDDDGACRACRRRNLDRVTISRPDLSPPMPPAGARAGGGRRVGPAAPARERTRAAVDAAGGRRSVPHLRGPIDAPAGRYLWLTLELRGNTRVSPSVRCIRAEHPAHDYLRRLPETLLARRARTRVVPAALPRDVRGISRRDGGARRRSRHSAHARLGAGRSAAVAGELSRSRARRAVGERAAPRWRHSVDARRDIIELAAWLFRFRGTVPGPQALHRALRRRRRRHPRALPAARPMQRDAWRHRRRRRRLGVGVGFRIGDAVGSDADRRPDDRRRRASPTRTRIASR